MWVRISEDKSSGHWAKGVPDYEDDEVIVESMEMLEHITDVGEFSPRDRKS